MYNTTIARFTSLWLKYISYDTFRTAFFIDIFTAREQSGLQDPATREFIQPSRSN
jgi:hypothetical protein